MKKLFLALILTLITSQAFAAGASIVAAFACYSNASGKVCAGQSGTNTMQAIGATFSKPGGKPTMRVDAPRVDVRAFGAKGNGVTEDSAAFNAAINSITSGVVVVPPGTYLVRDVNILNKTNLTLACEGGKLLAHPNIQSTHPMIRIGGGSNVIIDGCDIDGNYPTVKGTEDDDHRYLSTFYMNAVNVDASGYAPTNGFTLKNSYIHDNWGSGLRAMDTINLVVDNNKFHETDAATIFYGIQGATISNNTVTAAGTSESLQFYQRGTVNEKNTDIVVGPANVVHKRACFDSLDGAVIFNNTFDADYAVNGGQLYDTGPGTDWSPRNVLFTGNTVKGQFQFPYVGSSAVNGPAENIQIIGNTFIAKKNIKMLWCDNTNNLDVLSNKFIYDSALAVRGATAIEVGSIHANYGINVKDNTISFLGTDNALTPSLYMRFSGLTDANISGNVINTGVTGGSSNFLWLDSMTASGLQIYDNKAVGGLLYFGLNGHTPAYYENNYSPSDPTNSIVSAYNLALTYSAAQSEMFVVTGGNLIGGMSPVMRKGKRITLKFAVATNIQSGTGLLVPGGFNASANDTITLISDGSTWLETSRSHDNTVIPSLVATAAQFETAQFGAQSGGTNNGNIRSLNNDTQPGFQWNSGVTRKAALLADVTVGSFYLDTGGTFRVRKLDGTALFTLTNGGVGTLLDAFTATQFKLSALNATPASSSATCTTGELRVDANYSYACVATNTWKRSALTTW